MFLRLLCVVNAALWVLEPETPSDPLPLQYPLCRDTHLIVAVCGEATVSLCLPVGCRAASLSVALGWDSSTLLWGAAICSSLSVSHTPSYTTPRSAPRHFPVDGPHDRPRYSVLLSEVAEQNVALAKVKLRLPRKPGPPQHPVPPLMAEPADSSSDTQPFCQLASLHALESGRFSALNPSLFSFPRAHCRNQTHRFPLAVHEVTQDPRSSWAQTHLRSATPARAISCAPLGSSQPLSSYCLQGTADGSKDCPHPHRHPPQRALPMPRNRRKEPGLLSTWRAAPDTRDVSNQLCWTEGPRWTAADRSPPSGSRALPCAP